MLTQRGRAANISEENCNVDFRAAGRKVLTSGAADSGVFPRRPETQYSHQLATNSPERVEADFASRRTWQVTKNSMHRRHRRMSLDKNSAPPLFWRTLSTRRHAKMPSREALEQRFSAAPDKLVYDTVLRIANSPTCRKGVGRDYRGPDEPALHGGFSTAKALLLREQSDRLARSPHDVRQPTSGGPFFDRSRLFRIRTRFVAERDRERPYVTPTPYPAR